MLSGTAGFKDSNSLISGLNFSPHLISAFLSWLHSQVPYGNMMVATGLKLFTPYSLNPEMKTLVSLPEATATSYWLWLGHVTMPTPIAVASEMQCA